MLEFSNLRVKRGNKPIIKDVTGSIGNGKFVALLGENGAGKSTLLHALAGNLPSIGEIKLSGKALSHWDEQSLATKRAVLTQQTQLNFAFGVPELIAMGRYPLSETWQMCQHKVGHYIQLLDLSSLAGRTTDRLSGGELQRVHMARCLAQLDAFSADCQGKLILLDEPTSALDVKHQHRLLQLVKSFVEQGNSAIVAIHDLNLASLYADEVILLSRGQIIQQGVTNEVLNQQALEQVYQSPMHVSAHPFLNIPMIFSEPQELNNAFTSIN